MIKWGFYKFKANAEKCWNEITENLGDEYTPEDVLELARDEETELHKCFEWEDSIAAENWRKQQARFVCNSLTVVVEKGDAEPQSYRLIQHDHEDKVYRSIQLTVRNEDQYDRLLAQAKRELLAFEKRYYMIAELQNVIDEIYKIIN